MVELVITAILQGDTIHYEDYVRSVNLAQWESVFPNTKPHDVLRLYVQNTMCDFDDVLPDWTKMLIRQNEVHELLVICKNKGQRDVWKINFQKQEPHHFKQYELAYVLNRAFRDCRRKFFYCSLEMLMEPVTGTQMRKVIHYVEKNAMTFQSERYRNVAMFGDREKKLILTKDKSFTQYFNPLDTIVNWDYEFMIEYVREYFQNYFEHQMETKPKQKPLKPFPRISAGPPQTLRPVAPASRVVFTPVAHNGVMSSMVPLVPAARVLFAKPPPLPSPPSTPPTLGPLKQDGFVLTPEEIPEAMRIEQVDDYVVPSKRQKIPGLIDTMIESSRLFFLPPPRLLSDPW